MSYNKKNNFTHKFGNTVSSSLQEPLYPGSTNVTPESYKKICTELDTTLQKFGFKLTKLDDLRNILATFKEKHTTRSECLSLLSECKKMRQDI